MENRDAPPVESLPEQEIPREYQPETIPAPAAPSRWGAWMTGLRDILETVLLTLIIFFTIRFVVENYKVEGYSMEPNFHDGQYILVNKLAYRLGEPQRNDVIVFRYPLDVTQNYIKRVIGLPGDKVQITNGEVSINDVPLPERYPFIHADYSYGPMTVNPGEYFVLGDNRPGSSDSHYWGLVPTSDIIGKAWLSYWPPQMWGVVPDYSSARASP